MIESDVVSLRKSSILAQKINSDSLNWRYTQDTEDTEDTQDTYMVNLVKKYSSIEVSSITQSN
jgi:hypothetical protein